MSVFLRTIVISSFIAVFLAGCGSKTQSASPVFDHGLAQPPQLVEQSAPKEPAGQPQSHSLAVGTVVPVRSSSVIDSAAMFAGFVMGIVEADVNGADGRVAIPAGSSVAMVVRQADKQGSTSTLRMGLYSVNIAGHQYLLSNGAKDAATLLLTEDAGRQGAGHSSVHIHYGDHLEFKLDTPFQLH